MLSRYNLQTEAWRKTEAERQHQIDRQEQENDSEPVEAAQVFNASLAPKVYLQPLMAFLTYAFPAELIEPSGSRFPLPPTRATGLAKLKQCSTNTKDHFNPYPQDRKRVVLAIDAAGAPVFPALFLTGLTAEITEVSSATAPLTTPLSQSLDEFMDELLTDPASPCVDWIVATCPFAAEPGNKPSKSDIWTQEVIAAAKVLGQTNGLQAVIITWPESFPNSDRNARLSPTKPYPTLTMGHGWATQSMVLRNTHHGGPIETDHNLLVLLPTRACRHWKLAATTVSTPTPMSTKIDDDIDWYNDCVWSIDLSISKSKDVPAARIPNTDAFSARVDR